MSYFRMRQRLFSSILAILMLSLGVGRFSMAGIISTAELVNARQSAIESQQVHAWLARAEVRQQLTRMGVNVDAAQARVNSMTAREVHAMATEMKKMPAGAGVVETAMLVLLVLILLDLLGVTDIFPNI